MVVNNSTKPLVVSNMISPQRCVKKNHLNAHDKQMASMFKNNDFHSKKKNYFGKLRNIWINSEKISNFSFSFCQCTS